MSGFCKVAFVGEHFTQKIVNVFHFRSTEWLPGQGNPFDDVQSILGAIVTELQGSFLACHTQDYRLLRAEAVGYNDAYSVVTASPLVQTINTAGVISSLETTGSYQSANLGLQCGEQILINGLVKSKRNRGYLSIGPVGESNIDSYGHISLAYAALLESLAQAIDNTITVISPAVSLIPIRIHEKWVTVGPLRTLAGRTFSDVRGYTIPRVGSVRRSRMGEA